MQRTVALVGTDAVAEAMRQINPDVVPAYPITPQTSVVETFAQMIADGAVTSEMINVESEHSAMSAAIGAAAGGARVMTATSSQGLALMWEMLYIASGLACP
jgi:pyruvate ferredoxin oxidoreductase alpha subunit